MTTPEIKDGNPIYKDASVGWPIYRCVTSPTGNDQAAWHVSSLYDLSWFRRT